MSVFARVLLGVSVTAAAGAGVRGQEPPVERGWVGLYTPALAGSLENANRLDITSPLLYGCLTPVPVQYWYRCQTPVL